MKTIVCIILLSILAGCKEDQVSPKQQIQLTMEGKWSFDDIDVKGSFTIENDSVVAGTFTYKGIDYEVKQSTLITERHISLLSQRVKPDASSVPIYALTFISYSLNELETEITCPGFEKQLYAEGTVYVKREVTLKKVNGN